MSRKKSKTIPIDPKIMQLIELRETNRQLDNIKDFNGDLIVDDYDMNRMTLSRFLRDKGIHSEQCVDGLDAIEELCYSNYNTVWLDIYMPKLNGYETIEIIRNKYPRGLGYNGKIIAMSGVDDDNYYRRCKQLNFNHVICKPYDKTEIDHYRKSSPTTA